MGDNLAWNEFAEIRHGLDGEKSQTYAVACAELLRRDPTFFLRKYLKKDTKALEPGKLAYRWSDPKGRILYDEVYARRLYIATDAKERKRIGVFIDYTTSKR